MRHGVRLSPRPPLDRCVLGRLLKFEQFILELGQPRLLHVDVRLRHHQIHARTELRVAGQTTEGLQVDGGTGA